MRFKHIIHVIDSHTAGEPTRIIISGIPHLEGKSIEEKKDYFKLKYDFLRRAVLWEPRGHRDMFGTVLLPPTHPKAQIGAFFLDTDGYLGMCGHASIGLITACFETGILPKERPENGWHLDTPVGLIPFRAEFDLEKTQSVTIQNVPAFLFDSNLSLNVPGIGKIIVDVSFGGNFFLLVNATQIGIPIEANETKRLLDLGMLLMEVANKNIEVFHPDFKDKNSIELVEIYEDCTNEKADSKNIVILGNRQFDRSPCGTGTCAKMALKWAKGQLGLNVNYVQQSILGTFFTGKLISETKVGDFSAVIPEITGRAWISGFSQLVIDPEDPLAHGFLIG